MELLKELYLETQQLDDQNILDSIKALISEIRDLPKDAYTCTNMNELSLVDTSGNDLCIEFSTIEKLQAIPVHSFLNLPEMCLLQYALAFHAVNAMLLIFQI